MTPAVPGTGPPVPVPVAFRGCFGWFHAPPPAAARGRGVVLCNPFGDEAVATHRNWRALAAMLAAAGLPVLRFDYPGTGDSAEDGGGALIPAWLDAIPAAASWLRHAAGVDEIALCGLRLGALLAAAAAAARPGGIARLVLLAPPASGHGCARELQIVQQMSGRPHPEAGAVEAAGLRLQQADLDRLGTLDLHAALRAAGAAGVLVLEAPWQQGLGLALAAATPALVCHAPFAGYAEFLRDAHLASLPEADFARVTRWLAGDAPAGPLAGAPSGPPPAPASLRPAAAVQETALRFGADGGLFGILCAPAADAACTGTPALLILNTGANHHVGNSRLAVLLARRLAAAGTVSLRMDITGFGDSDRAALGPAGGAADAYRLSRLRLYRAEFRDDVIAALDELARRGHPRCVAMGVCSGANLALHAALHDRRIIGLVLANMTFFDRAGGAPGDTARAGPLRTRIGRAVRPVAGRARRLRRRLFSAAFRYTATLAVGRLRLAGWGIWTGLTHTVATVSRRDWACGRCDRWMRILAASGVETLFVFSEDDPGLREWQVRFGRARPGPGRPDGRDLVIIAGQDHAFGPFAMRDRLMEAVVAFLGRCGRPACAQARRHGHAVSGACGPPTTEA